VPDPSAAPALATRPKRGSKGKKPAPLETDAPVLVPPVSSPTLGSPRLGDVTQDPEEALEAAVSALASHMGRDGDAVMAARDLGLAAPVRARALLVLALLRACKGPPSIHALLAGFAHYCHKLCWYDGTVHPCCAEAPSPTVIVFSMRSLYATTLPGFFQLVTLDVLPQSCPA
jgi:hypothetical protein